MNSRITILISIAFGLILVGIWLAIVDVTAMVHVLKEVRLSVFLPLFFLFVLMYLLRSLRWKIILSPVERITLGDSFNLCMTNYFVNFLIPVHAGEIVKCVLLKKMKGTLVSESLWTAYIDKLTDLLPLFVLLLVAPFLKSGFSSTIYLTCVVVLVVLALLIFSAVFVYKIRTKFYVFVEYLLFMLPASFRDKVITFFKLSVEGLSSISQLRTMLFQIFALTMLAAAFHCFFMWLFFHSFGVNLPVFTVLIGYLLLNASFILPAPPGFSGSLELTFLFIFSYLFGYDKNLVSTVAASSHVFIAILFALFGFTSLAFIGTRLSTVLKMESDNVTGFAASDLPSFSPDSEEPLK